MTHIIDLDFYRKFRIILPLHTSSVSRRLRAFGYQMPPVLAGSRPHLHLHTAKKEH